MSSYTSQYILILPLAIASSGDTIVQSINIVGGAITFCNVSITRKFGLCTQTLPPSVLLGEWLGTRLGRRSPLVGSPDKGRRFDCTAKSDLYYLQTCI